MSKMILLRKFLLISTVDVWLLIKAALLLAAIRLGMWLLPFRALRRLLTRAEVMSPKRRLQHAGHASADGVTWAIEVASRHMPGAKSCLTQALAAQVLLTRRGHPALLHIGVAKGERGRFQAHAWVESGGNIVTGGSGVERFAPLTVL